MKKGTLLVAMLILASMTVFGEWTVSGLAEYKLNLTEEATERDSDEYLIINLSTMLNDTTSLSLEYDTDDVDPDEVGTILVNKKLNDKVEAQVSTDLISDEEGTRLKESQSDGTYVKMMVSDKLTATVYPFEAGTGLGDELETADTQDELGFEFAYTVSDELSTVFVVNTLGNDDKEESYLGLKAEATMTKENLEVIAGLSMTTADEVLYASYTGLAVSARAAYTMDKLSLNGELLFAGSNAKDADAGLAIYAKGAYDLGAKAGFSSTEVYVEATIADEDVYYDGTSDMQLISVGVTGTWNDVYMTPEISTETLGDADATTELSMTIGVEF